jgi:aspartokinase
MYTSEDEALVSAYGVPDDPAQITTLFSKIGEQGIIIDMISQTAPAKGLVSISFTLPRQDADRTMTLFEGFQSAMPRLKVDIDRNITKITVQGPGMETQSGIAAQVFQVMADQGIGLKTITTSETKISYIIHQQDGERAVDAIRKAFDI